MHDATMEHGPAPGIWYRLVNKCNDKTLQVDAEQYTQNGKFISQSDGLGPGEHAQQWQLQRVPHEDGWWVVRNRASNKVLEVDALHPHLNGDYVQQWDYLGANAYNQHWGLGRVE